jgi:hypothetical protein
MHVVGISERRSLLRSFAGKIARSGVATIRRRQQRREQSLQSVDQQIRLARSLLLIGDLLVFDRDLAAQKFILAFETRDIAIFCRRWSQLVDACRCSRSRAFVVILRGDICRGMPRHVVIGRDKSHLIDVGDMPIDRGRRDQKLVAERRLNAVAIEIAFRAIALDAARCARHAGFFIESECIFNGEGIIAVAGCRGLPRQVDACRCFVSRLVGVHSFYDTAPKLGDLRLSPETTAKINPIEEWRVKIVDHRRSPKSMLRMKRRAYSRVIE